MGITINEQIELDSNIAIQNVYITIRGQFAIHKINNNYQVSASCIGYKDQDSYENSRNPILHIRVSEQLQSVSSNTDFYTILYSKLKTRVKEIFKNDNLTFQDVL
jgi:hypothetical protein